jgi:hypothetical protein
MSLGKFAIVTFLLLISVKIFAQTEVISVIRQDCSGDSNCYSSLAEWQTDYGGIDFGSYEQGDLVGADKIAVVRIEGNWTEPDTGSIAISGWNTDADHYIQIYTTPEARHDGTPGSGYSCREIYNTAAYIRIEGLEVYSESGHCIYLRPKYILYQDTAFISDLKPKKMWGKYILITTWFMAMRKIQIPEFIIIPAAELLKSGITLFSMSLLWAIMPVFKVIEELHIFITILSVIRSPVAVYG